MQDTDSTSDNPYPRFEKGPPEGYVELCLMVLEFATTPQELRNWWRDGAEQRRFYELTPEHEAVLIKACKERMRILEAAEQAKPKPKPRYQPRRARI